MAKPIIHAQNSARKFGGEALDYIEIHEFMDSSKSVVADNRHRALTHNSWFISFILPKVFGETFTRKSDGKVISTRDIGEQHVLEDFAGRFIPSASDFISLMEPADWINGVRTDFPHSAKKLKPSSTNEKIKHNRHVRD